jgi:hypothetical protein
LSYSTAVLPPSTEHSTFMVSADTAAPWLPSVMSKTHVCNVTRENKVLTS